MARLPLLTSVSSQEKEKASFSRVNMNPYKPEDRSRYVQAIWLGIKHVIKNMGDSWHHI
jgi:hypothetical protein